MQASLAILADRLMEEYCKQLMRHYRIWFNDRQEAVQLIDPMGKVVANMDYLTEEPEILD